MEKDPQATGAILALVMKSAEVPRAGGSDTFKYIEPGHFAEKTISILPIGAPTVHRDTGKFDIRFVIERFGDLAHTFVLKYVPQCNSDGIIWDSAELRSVAKLGRIMHCERITRDANNALIRAYNWPVSISGSLIAEPLMFRETVDHRNTYIPLICDYGLVDEGLTTYEVIIKGLDHVYGLHLDVDYVYLETTARRKLAQHPLIDLHMPICDYVSCTFDNFADSVLMPLKVNLCACAKMRALNNVTGLMITHVEGDLQSFALDLNGQRHSAWDASDNLITWKKAGLNYGYCPLLPFSSDAIKDLVNAAWVDFSRIDHLTLYIWGDVTSITVVALGHRTRFLGSGHVLIDAYNHKSYEDVKCRF